MKICRYIGFSFVLAMFLLTSCFDDKGNYDYKEIGEAVIKAIPGVTGINWSAWKMNIFN